MPAGRPSKYKPEYCEKLINYMAKGMSFDTFGPEVGVWTSTLYYWVDKYPEFSDAKKEGEKRSYRYWQLLGMQLATGKMKGNAAVWIFNMKNRFKWTDRFEHSHDDETPAKLIIEIPKKQIDE